MNFEKDIQRGFNAGYLLEKHNPDLSKQLQSGFTDKEHPFVQGFIAGRQEFAKETTQEKAPYLSKYLDKPEEPPSQNRDENEPEL